ncbi:MAG: hypothetical protein RI996_262 [Candidatus Parcubacteria bacterium]|jgi:hypothetical protein
MHATLSNTRVIQRKILYTIFMIADTYIYLCLSVLFAVFWFLVFLRSGETTKLLQISFMGGVAGLVAEYWYFKDYWQPVSVLGHRVVSIEDFIFGFTVTGISFAIYSILNKTVRVRTHKKDIFFGICLFIGGLVALILLTKLKVNSIFASTFIFVSIFLYISYKRHELFMQGVVSGLILLLLAICIYVPLFGIISPEYWNTYYLLHQTIFDMRVFNIIPITELIWYFSWGCLAGTLYDYVSGKVQVKTRD